MKNDTFLLFPTLTFEVSCYTTINNETLFITLNIIHYSPLFSGASWRRRMYNPYLAGSEYLMQR